MQGLGNINRWSFVETVYKPPCPGPTPVPGTDRHSQSCPLSHVLSVFSEAFASVFISTVIVVRNNYIYIILYIFPFSFPPDFFIRTIHFHISAQNQKYVFLQINCSLSICLFSNHNFHPLV